MWYRFRDKSISTRAFVLEPVPLHPMWYVFRDKPAHAGARLSADPYLRCVRELVVRVLGQTTAPWAPHLSKDTDHCPPENMWYVFRDKSASGESRLS